MESRRQYLLYDLKWRKLLKLAEWFRFLPFIEFVMASGSMALGNVDEKSDFDLLVGVKQGRMFTARYFALALFTLLGVRRMDDDPESSPDKLCFNHFVTSSVYAKPPFNTYRRELYRNLVPVFGNVERIREFFKANKWCGRDGGKVLDLRYKYRERSGFGQFFEVLFGGRFGDWIENNILGPMAKQRLSEYVDKMPKTGRVVISNAELEFHFRLPYEGIAS